MAAENSSVTSRQADEEDWEGEVDTEAPDVAAIDKRAQGSLLCTVGEFDEVNDSTTVSERATGRWYRKYSSLEGVDDETMNAYFADDAVHGPYEVDLREATTLQLYDLLEVSVPHVCLCEFPLKLGEEEENVERGETGAEEDAENAERPVLHLLVERRRGLTAFSSDFLTAYVTHARTHPEATFCLDVRNANGSRNVTVPLTGLGRFLAVAGILGDNDGLGEFTSEVGYTVDANTGQAHIVKLRAPDALDFLPPRVPAQRSRAFDAIASLNYNLLTRDDQEEYLATVKNALLLLTPRNGALVGALQCLRNDLDNRLGLSGDYITALAEAVEMQLARVVKLVARELDQVIVAEWEEVTARLVQRAILADVSTPISAERLNQVQGHYNYLRGLATRQGETDTRQGAQCRTFQLPTSPANYVARDELVAQISDALQPGERNVLIQALCGSGGVGKSALAARVAIAAAAGQIVSDQHPFGQVAWLRGESDADFEAQCVALAERWCVVRPERLATPLAELWYQLSHAPRPTLIVIDNKVTLESVWSFLLPPADQPYGPSRVHILVTTRDVRPSTIPTLRVDTFSLEETTAFLSARLPNTSAIHIKELHDSLGGLPLGLAQAVAYMQARGLSVGDFLAQYRNSQIDLILHGTLPDDPHPRSLGTLVALSLAHVTSEMGIAEAAISVAGAAAYLFADGVSAALLQRASGVKDDAFPVVVALLQAHGLLEERSPRVFGMHRLTQDCVRFYVDCKHRAARVEQASLDAVMAQLNPDLSRDARIDAARSGDVLAARLTDKAHAHYPVLLTLLSHAFLHVLSLPPRTLAIASEAVVRELNRLTTHNNLGGVVLDLATDAAAALQAHDALVVQGTLLQAAYTAAQALTALVQVPPAVAILERLWRDIVQTDPNSVDAAKVLVALGAAALATGDADRAEASLQRALELQERLLGAEDAEVAVTLVNLGVVWGRRGDVAKERDLCERALRIKERHFGPNHAEVAVALNNLANAYGSLGDAFKRRELLERALAIREQLYGPDHVEVGIVLGNLGGACLACGDAARARAILERAMAIDEENFGQPRVSTLNSLANACGALGDDLQHRELLERALRAHARQDGRDDLPLAITLVNLCNAYAATGNELRRRELLERALAIKEAHYGVGHYEVAIVLNNLANVHGSLGDLPRKRVLLERALTIRQAHFGPQHPDTADTLHNLANVIGAMGNPEEQLKLLMQVLTIKNAHLGNPEHVEIAGLLLDIAGAMSGWGLKFKQNGQEVIQRQLAMQQRGLLEKALGIRERQYGATHRLVADILTNLGTVYEVLGELDLARGTLERAVVVLEATLDAGRYEVAIALNNLASVLGKLGLHAPRRDMLLRALAIESAHYGADHFEVATTLFNLGNAYLALQDAAAARDAFERSLVIRERHFGPTHLIVAATLSNLAVAYSILGNVARQAELLERVARIREVNVGPDHISLALGLSDLGNAYRVLGNLPLARDVLRRAVAILEQHHDPQHAEVGETLMILAAATEDPEERFMVLGRTAEIFMAAYGEDHPRTLMILRELA